MKHLIFALTFCVSLCCSLQATHYRAGDISYAYLSQNRFEVTVITYTDPGNPDADRDTLPGFAWGDGTTETVFRVNGPDSDGDGIPNGEIIRFNIQKNIYKATHQYAGPGRYVITMLDPNRVGGILNMDNSIGTQFFLEDTLIVYQEKDLSFNNSPLLLNPPIDNASIDDTFRHNPGAFDPDGDSLYYRLVVPKQGAGIDVDNYRLPHLVDNEPTTFTLDSLTGEIVWATPKQTGEYNVAFVVEEYRDGLFLGSVLRDMQIFVLAGDVNDPPIVEAIQDTCVRANEFLEKEVFVSDPNDDPGLTLSAFGGPLNHPVSPAEFNTNGPGVTVTGNFTWQTECEHIRKYPYQVIFKGEDNVISDVNAFIGLADIQTWQIEVVAPPPLNVQASLNNNTATISWDAGYECSRIDTFLGFSVWRRVGPNPFVPGPCDIGLEGQGYQMIADGLFSNQMTDVITTQGQKVCYRVLAHFAQSSPNGNIFNETVSIPSDEVCLEIGIDGPLIQNIDIRNTDEISGSVFVRWLKPLTTPGNLDTTNLSGPYQFTVDRIHDGTTERIFSTSAPTFAALNDTFLIDSSGLLNTTLPVNYTVDFFANDVLIQETPEAPSIFLEITSSDQSLLLNWNNNTSWVDTAYEVRRRILPNGPVELVATTLEPRFNDIGLTNDVEYEYQITGLGVYTNDDVSALNLEIVNRSQTKIGIPQDTTPPCAPRLAIDVECPEFADDVNFDIPITVTQNERCAEVLSGKNIYRRLSQNDTFTLVGTIEGDEDVFNYINPNYAGFYVATNLDSVGNESVFSNEVLLDNCPFYELPNVFTPNGDGDNDIYHPILPYNFVRSIDMKIFNRWGHIVFETTDPDINWDGIDKNTGRMVDDGVYFYQGTYEEDLIQGGTERELPGSDRGGGFIHVITK